MSKASPSNLTPGPVSVGARIEQVCDRFEDAWRADQRPRLEDYLDAVPQAKRRELLHELLRVDVVYRRRQGEQPRAEDYRFPDLDPTWLADLLSAPPATVPVSRPSADSAREDLPAVPGYEILGELGRGGMGVVYKARHLGSGRVVALKCILARGAGSSEAVERFRREARALAELDHPNIVPVHDIGEVDGQHYFTMPLVRGGSLQQVVAEGPLPPRVAAHLVRQVADAVQHAHARDIVHRDIKPHNILLQGGDAPAGASPGAALRQGGDGPDGLPVPRLGDFGLARLGEGEPLTVSGHPMGTPGYMPPEQATGQQQLVGRHSDTYSLGAVLYCLVTGRPPFQASSAVETLRLVCDEEPVPPRQLNPAVPRDLETICLKALAKEPARRYATAQALAEDLRRFLAGEPIQARPAGAVERWVLWVRRRPVTAALLGVSVVAAMSLTGLAVSGFYHGELATAYEETKVALASATTARDQAEQSQQAEAQQRRVAETARKDADSQRRLAEEARRQAEWFRYFASVLAAQNEWRENRVSHAEDLLAACPEELRHWEWHYLRRLCHRGVLLGHNAGVTGVCFSPDDKALASAGWDGTVKVWDATTGQQSASFKPHSAQVNSVCFSPDGKRLVTASQDGTVKIWDRTTGKLLLSFSKHQQEVYGATFSPDGKRLASVGPKEVLVWDPATGETAFRLRGPADGMRGVAFSPDGKRLAGTGWNDGTVKVWDALTGQELATFRRDGREVQSVAFSPDGQRLAAGGRDKTVRVWDIKTAQEVLTLKGEDVPVGLDNLFLMDSPVCFSPDGQWLAAGSGDQTVKVWDTGTGQELFSLRGHTGLITGLAFSADGQRLASASQDGTVQVWDAATGQEARTLEQRAWYAVAFSPDGRRLASDSPQGNIRVWDAATGEDVLCLQGHNAPVFGLTFSPDGQRLASASQDWTVKVWDARNGRQLLTLRGHTAAIIPSALGLAGGLPNLWQVGWTAGAMLMAGHTNLVMAVAFSPDGQQLASGDGNGMLKVWDARTGQIARTIRAHQGIANRVAFSPDGQFLVSSNTGQLLGLGRPELKVWDVQTGAEVRSLEGHTGEVYGLAFSPDGRRLASASLDKTIRVWEMQTGKTLLVLRGHTKAVTGVSFSLDGGRLASSSRDRTVKVWDTREGQEVITLRGHTSDITSVAFSPDGQRIVTSARGTVKVWDAEDPRRDLRADRRAVLEKRRLVHHRQEAEACEKAERWFAAVFHLGRLIEAEPADGGHRGRRGLARAVLGEWDQARRDAAEAVKATPDHFPLWWLHAELQLQGGNHVAYRKACTSILERFGRTADPSVANALAWVCVLAPEAVPDLGPVVQLAQKAMTGDSKNPDYLLTLGAAHYRAGQFDLAVRRLNDALAAGGKSDNVQAWLFLALAHHRLGQPEEARRNWARAARWVEEYTRANSKGPAAWGKLPWDYRLELQLLLRETKQELKEKGPGHEK